MGVVLHDHVGDVLQHEAEAVGEVVERARERQRIVDRTVLGRGAAPTAPRVRGEVLARHG